MRICCKNTDIKRAIELFKSFCDAYGVQLRDEGLTAYNAANECVGGFLNQGDDFVTCFMRDEYKGFAEHMASVEVSLAGTITLYSIDTDKAKAILLQRSDINILSAPRYHLHRGAIEVQLGEGALVLTWFGNTDVMTHALAVATKLKGAVV